MTINSDRLVQGKHPYAQDSPSIKTSWDRLDWLRKVMSNNFFKNFFSSDERSPFFTSVFEGDPTIMGNHVVYLHDGIDSGYFYDPNKAVSGKGELTSSYYDAFTLDRSDLTIPLQESWMNISLGSNQLKEKYVDTVNQTFATIRMKNLTQYILDSLQGIGYYEINSSHRSGKFSQRPTHAKVFNELSFANIENIRNSLDTGEDYVRPPTDLTLATSATPYEKIKKKRISIGGAYLVNGIEEMERSSEIKHYMFVTPRVASKFRGSAEFKDVFKYTANRGENNNVITGHIGTISNIAIIQVPTYIGFTNNSGRFTSENVGISKLDNLVSTPGLREMDANGLWTGQRGFDPFNVILSRGVILGAKALLYGYHEEGITQPSYKTDPIEKKYQAFASTFFNVKISKIHLESGHKDPEGLDIDGVDFGRVAVDFIGIA